MKRMEVGHKYTMKNMDLQENEYMDYLVKAINDYLDELNKIEFETSKIRTYFAQKYKTREELKKEYDALVSEKKLQNQSFEEFFVNERNKELEYNSIIIHFQETLPMPVLDILKAAWHSDKKRKLNL